MEMHGSRRVVIVGGGLSGSSTAVQLVRRSSAPLAITVVEPRARVGGGLAHSSDEPDHRLNGQPGSQIIDPEDEARFARWCEANEVVTSDPGARLSNGTVFMRRSVFRRFLEETVAEHAAWSTGSSIRHLRDRVIDVVPGEKSPTVVTACNTKLDCDLVVLAPGHTSARLRSFWPGIHSTCPSHRRSTFFTAATGGAIGGSRPRSRQRTYCLRHRFITNFGGSSWIHRRRLT